MADQLLVLHLSDLHLGAGELRPEDAKQTIPQAERRGFVTRLTSYLRALPAQPHVVCVTGDITNRGDPSGIRSFLDWVKPLIDDGTLPPPDRFMITPGNHDVKRRASDATEQFQDFYEAAKAFPHAFVPGHDPAFAVPAFDAHLDYVGGMKTALSVGKVEVVTSMPFLYDRRARLLVFAFNSSLACGVYPEESKAVLAEIDKAAAMAGSDSALTRQLKEIRDRAADTLLLDAGLVGDPQIAYFNDVMISMRKALGAEWRRITKVAVLHHHLNSIWRQELELKPFESVIDAAQVKEALTDFGFDAVLHGHKHKNGVSLDTTVVPTTTERGPDPIGIVSGGTVCGYPALGEPQTFKVLILDRSQKRESAVVEEYPLRGAPDPAQAMRAERRVYRLPLADRTPEVHDDRSLKRLLDKMLLDDCVRNEGAIRKVDRGEVKLGGDTDLVAGSARYRFAASIKTESREFLIDVFLATSRLDFRQRARVHWMLVEAKHYAEGKRAQPQIRLLIGNLAGTHFSRERAPGEIAESISELRLFFAPAIATDLLDIRERPLSQRDIDALDREIPAATRQSY